MFSTIWIEHISHGKNYSLLLSKLVFINIKGDLKMIRTDVLFFNCRQNYGRSSSAFPPKISFNDLKGLQESSLHSVQELHWCAFSFNNMWWAWPHHGSQTEQRSTNTEMIYWPKFTLNCVKNRRNWTSKHEDADIW